KAGMLKAIADKKLDSFLETAKKEFAKLDPKDFGGFLRHGAFKDLLAKLAEMKKEDLEDEDFLRKLFDDPSILAALQLTAEDPNADEKPEEEKPEEDEEEKPGDENKNDKPTPSLDEQVNDQNKNAQQEQDGQEQGPPAKD